LIGTVQGTVENYETTINQQQYDKIEIQKQQIVIATASKLKSVVILRDSPIEYLDVIVE
jgi:ABC-type oligopeptide transport system ATPase subunit